MSGTPERFRQRNGFAIETLYDGYITSTVGPVGGLRFRGDRAGQSIVRSQVRRRRGESSDNASRLTRTAFPPSDFLKPLSHGALSGLCKRDTAKHTLRRRSGTMSLCASQVCSAVCICDLGTGHNRRAGRVSERHSGVSRPDQAARRAPEFGEMRARANALYRAGDYLQAMQLPGRLRGAKRRNSADRRAVPEQSWQRDYSCFAMRCHSGVSGRPGSATSLHDRSPGRAVVYPLCTFEWAKSTRHWSARRPETPRETSNTGQLLIQCA